MRRPASRLLIAASDRRRVFCLTTSMLPPLRPREAVVEVSPLYDFLACGVPPNRQPNWRTLRPALTVVRSLPGSKKDVAG